MKVLLDRTSDLLIDIEGNNRGLSLNRYTYPHVPIFGYYPKMIAIFQQQTTLLGLDGLPVRHSPQIFLTFLQPLQKFLLKIAVQVGPPDINRTYSLLGQKIVDHFNNSSAHAAYLLIPQTYKRKLVIFKYI